jgi:HSP20 family protein
MDMNKMLQWMEIAKKYQSDGFWNSIFEQSSFDEFMKSNYDFGQTGEPPKPPQHDKKFPPIDIYKTDEEILLVADLPGYVKEDIQLSVSSTKLSIKGAKNNFIAGEPVQQERYQGDFHRIIQLPEPAYPNHIRAKFTNGLLIISYKRHFSQEERVPID